MNKKQILNHLENEVYCHLKPSKISGVGVFAMRDIPKSVNPFKEKDVKYIPLSEKELVNVPSQVKEFIKQLFVFSVGKYWFPEQGVQTLCITHFLNHSKKPNLTTSPSADLFFAIRDITAGEELTVDYGTFDDLTEEHFR